MKSKTDCSVTKSPSLVTLSGAWAVPVVEAAGSAREIGRINGLALKDAIHAHSRLFRLPDFRADSWRRRRDALQDGLFRHVPQVLEELIATAEAADVPLDLLLLWNGEPQCGTAEPLAYPPCDSDACTNVVFAGGPDGPIWGKNNDHPATEACRPAVARVVQRMGRIPVVTFTYAGFVATADGMNAVGLAIGHSSVGSVFEQRNGDVPLRIWAYEGLMRCATTEEFIEHMCSVPLRGKGYAITCVDAAGKAVSLEAACPLVQVRRPANPSGHIEAVNLYQLPALANADRRNPAAKELTARRRDWLDRKLALPSSFSLADMQAILASRAFPAICRSAEAPDTSETEYSMIALPAKRQAMFLYGKPGESAYATLQFNAVAAVPPRAPSVPSSELDAAKLKTAMERACHWIQHVAQLQTDELPGDTLNRSALPYTRWAGALRGEYSAASKTWWFFCPVWHTGQAVKALLAAEEVLGQPAWRHGAKRGAEFICHHQVLDEASPDYGLILAYEDLPTEVNTSAMLECMDGLMLLASAEQDEAAWKRLVAAGEFILAKTFMPGEGLFRDVYNPQTHAVRLPNPYRTKDDIGGRPLLDDAVFARLYARTGHQPFLDAHVKVSRRLVADQRPRGNWIDYGPCHAAAGLFHPRQTYWWSLPLLESYRLTGDRQYLETVIASGEFLARAMRRDGGFFRGTYADFGTDSFGHAASGSACAAILFLGLFKATRESRWLELAQRALRFCMNMQLLDVKDQNLDGAVLEKVLPPDHTDASPYHIRDLGTIFFVIAAAEWVRSV